MIQVLKGHCCQFSGGLFQLVQIPVIGLQLVCLIKNLPTAVGNQNRQTMVLLMHQGPENHFFLPEAFQKHRKTLVLNLSKSASLYIFHLLNGSKTLLISIVLLNQQPHGFILCQSLF